MRAVYEQMPWDPDKVAALYRNLRGSIVADGDWHAIPGVRRSVALYRVFTSAYMQAIFADEGDPVVGPLMQLTPPEIGDDTQWDIWQIEEGYALTSVFATMCGPLRLHREVDEWLARHGLGLIPEDDQTRGVAYFETIDQGCLADAIERLRWLEHAFGEITEEYERMSADFWGALQAESDEQARAYASLEAAGEIVPLPARYPRRGWKRREPVNPEDDVTPTYRPEHRSSPDSRAGRRQTHRQRL